MCLVAVQAICLVETQDMCCVESEGKGSSLGITLGHFGMPLEALGDLGTLWEHFGVTLGGLVYSKGTLGISLCQSFAFHENPPKVWEGCSKTHVLEH